MSDARRNDDERGLPLMPTTAAPKADYQAFHGRKEISVENPAVNINIEKESQEQQHEQQHHKTTVLETFLHLLKGFLGAGCLSLPWAVSQLGIGWGVVAILTVACWTSFNCWTLVRLKRYVERHSSYMEDKKRLALESASASSSASSNNNITCPDLGEWAYGEHFKSYVRACICTLQLAICTVFFSFVGENLHAVFEYFNIEFVNHTGVMTIFLPVILSLSFIPSLKTLAPVMASGLYLLLFAFVGIGVIIREEWHARPGSDDRLEFIPSQAPLAVCAILYSMEGINLILPVESAMKEPRHFKRVFVLSMAANALILATFATICVLTFGEVTNGSVTAFLLQAYKGDASVTLWLMLANTAVSLSVLVTYPLHMYPAVELLALWFHSNKEEDPLSTANSSALTDSAATPIMEHSYNKEEEQVLQKDEPTGSYNLYIRSQSTISSMRSALLPQMTIPGDSLQLRTTLVLMTYVAAVVVPNVQVLISLVGAMAGSSVALLIPPLLELGWIRHIEVGKDDVYKEDEDEDESSKWWMDDEAEWWMATAASPYTNRFGKFWFAKLKCYALLVLGLVFFGIGTWASLADIVRIYNTNTE
jgi:proton-coupled amino acid transporter